MSRNRSIMHVADYAPTYSGNFVASLRLAAAECRARGFDLVWVFPEEVKTYSWFHELGEESHCSLYVLPRSGSLIQSAWRITELAARHNVAIVHTHFCRFDIAAALAKIVCGLRLQAFHLVWHMHSAFGPETNWSRRLKDAVKLRVLGRICHSVPVSGPLGEDVRERGFPPERIHVIQNGIDLEHATAKRRSRAEVRRQLRVPDNATVLLGFGWTPIRKGVDTMLEALRSLMSTGVPAVLVLVGTQELKDYLERWPDQPLLSSVRVIPPEEMVGELFASADVFLSPSRAEGWCYAVAEAIANGVPAAAAWIPAVSWAEHAPGVLFSAPGDSDALASNVRCFLALSHDQREELASRAKDFIRERHSVEHWGRSVWQLYASLLEWNEPPQGRSTAVAR